MTGVLLTATALLLPTVGGGAPDPRPHDLHIAYADLAVEGKVVAGRLRFFEDDLERALGSLVDATALELAPGPEADALVLRYLDGHLRLEDAGGRRLAPELVASGRDELDREPVWWVVVQYRAETPVQELRVRNTLLFEVFGDQRNVMKFVRFPEERPQTFYFAPGESDRVVRFD
ncbi:MAG: hypothetical protein RLN75_01660 [Longimicrobiales bacterium]